MVLPLCNKTTEAMTTAYRYNAKDRKDRDFNNCSREKNPNAVRFYATNLEYAEGYKYVYNRAGEVVYECELEVVSVDTAKCFDMNANFRSLTTYQNYIQENIDKMVANYTALLNAAKTQKDRTLWMSSIEEAKNFEQEQMFYFVKNEFQFLSDFERQNELIAELTALGFNGYFTKNEIALF